MVSLTEILIFFSYNPRSQQWREMFESFDYNQDGIIDAAELESALNHYECALFRLKLLRSISEDSYLTTD
jgi:Ca2+-binding EF-hand superfamily protein